MLYVLLILVVALAMVAGAEYAMMRVAMAERRAEVAELREANRNLAEKNNHLINKNKELSARLGKMTEIKEVLN